MKINKNDLILKDNGTLWISSYTFEIEKEPSNKRYHSMINYKNRDWTEPILDSDIVDVYKPKTHPEYFI